MTRKQRIAAIKEALEKSTKVNSWSPHSGGDCHGKEATVRGPFFRWFKVTPVEDKYKKHVAYDLDDAKYCAIAMNSIPFLLSQCESMEKAINTTLDKIRENRNFGGYTCDMWIDDQLRAALEEKKDDEIK